jgi:hypothetical protein
MISMRYVMALALATPVAMAGYTAAAATEDKAPEVIVAARSALGGKKLEAVKSISATGEYRRTMGAREINGEATVEILLPDKIKRTEEMGIQGGPTFSRTVALDGSEYWEDSTNRGGGGFARFGGAGGAGGQGGPSGRGGPNGPGGPGGPGGQGPSEADRERFRQMAQRRLQNELQRYLLVWLLRTDAPMSYVGEAEAEDGKADVVEVKPEGGSPIRVFFDQKTHVPLMVSYEGPQMRRFVRQAGEPRPSSEEVRRQMAEPPKMVTYEIRFSDYKDVNGVLLPHQMTQSVEGKPTEEWTVSEFKVNPNLKPESFAKKSKS